MQVGHVLGSHLAVSMAKDGAAWEFGKVCMELKLQCFGSAYQLCLAKGWFFGRLFQTLWGGGMAFSWHFPSSLQISRDLHVGGSESQKNFGNKLQVWN